MRRALEADLRGRPQECRETQGQRGRGRCACRPPSRSAKRNVSQTVGAAAKALPSTKNAFRSASGCPHKSVRPQRPPPRRRTARRRSRARGHTASKPPVHAAVRVHSRSVGDIATTVLDDFLRDLVRHGVGRHAAAGRGEVQHESEHEHQERIDAVPARPGQLHVSILGVAGRVLAACSNGTRSVSPRTPTGTSARHILVILAGFAAMTREP